MARRGAGKAKPKSATALGKAGKPRTSDLRERLAAVERERDQLRATLDVEQARRRKLEEVHATARDRIAWALDSLQSILDAKS